MDSWKKLFQVKRVLALFLAVVLTVPTMPISAYAAPDETVAAETVTVETVEETEVVSGSEEDTAEISSVVEEDVVEQEIGTDVSEGESVTPEVSQETHVYAIEDRLTDASKVKEYTGNAVFNLGASEYIDGIVITKDEEVYASVLNTDGYTYKWQAEKDGTYTDMAADAVPVNAGKYRLVVSVPEVADTYKAMTKEIDFEITKAALSVSWGYDAVKPGMKVSDIKLSYLEVYDNEYNYYSYTPDNAATTDVNENAESQLAYSIKIKDTFSGNECAADSIINKTSDYVIEVTPSFTAKVSAEVQANYEAIPVVIDELNISNLVATRIKLTLGEKWTESGRISRDYKEDTAVALDNTDYTAVVQYENGTDEMGNTVWADIADAELTTTWYDAYGNVLETAPTDAGEYYAVLSYAGKAGLYDTCTSSRIYVYINRAAITIRPYIVDNTSFFAGTTAYEVLQKVDYDVYDASDAKMNIDKATFWGNYVYYDEATLSYEPEFAVQESYETTDENGAPAVAYTTVSEDSVLQKGKTYRVIFTGYKAVYYDDYEDEYDDVFNRESINYIDGDAGSSDPNYAVTVDIETREKYTATVKVAEGTLATISVSELLGEANKGASYENPLNKVYDGNDFYGKRLEYKKAVVTAPGIAAPIAQYTDEALTYTWYYQSGTTSQWNDETQQYDQVPSWYSTSYDKAPYKAGNYKLEVSYQHENNEFVAEPVCVYYQIEKQKVKVVPTGDYTVLTETYVQDFIDYTDFTYDIYTVPAEGEGQKLDWYDYSHTVYWTVERQVTDEENNVSWVDARGEKFEKDAVYRLAVDELEMHYYSLYNNYVNYEIVTEGEGENVVTKTVYLNETKDITVKVMGSTELAVVVSEPINIEKVYDGVPVDISQQIAEGKIKLVTKADNKEVTDATVTAVWYNEAYDEMTDAPVNAGTYAFYIYFEGSETYHELFAEITNVTAKITPAEVTVTPVVKEEVKAGKSVPYVKEKTTFEGIADADKDAFVYKPQYNEISHSYNYGWEAFTNNNLVMTVKDKNGNTVDSGNYQGGKEYTVTANLEDVYYPYSRNYTFKANTAVFTPVRGNASVSAYDLSTGDVFIVSDKIDKEKNEHVIIPEEGIPYFSGMIDGGYTDGNYLAIQITAPEEYDYIPVSAVYENQLKAAGAYEIYAEDNYIIAIFNASLYDQKTFSIRWEEGYTEKFILDFSNASLLDNLDEAQAPKSISLISPAKKMTIGDYQQLDVKLTKVLESDIISLKYESSNKDVLCVSEDGVVTALAAGTATVTVSSVRTVNGETVDTDPVKKASVTITVSGVSAPKIKKVSPWDVDVNITYTNPGNGYRREIYILEGKKTKDDFETAIASMKNQKWEGIFVTAPYYWESYSASRTAYLSGLEPNTEYTVYVRNVSRLGALCDCGHGCEVTESTAGVVKTFKTTKLQVRYLDVYFDDGITKYDYDTNVYKVKLSDKNTTASVIGYFPDADKAADADDYVEKELPLDKTLQNDYVNPKLKYYVGTISSVKSKDTLVRLSYNVYLNKTSIASINAKGKITLKGVGRVYVAAYDTISEYSDYVALDITASADSITGKTTTLKLGQSIELSELLTYKEGNKVLKGDYDTFVIVDEVVKKAFEESPYFDLYGTTVVAVKSGGTLQVTLSDAYVGAEKTAVATLKSSVLDPVKNLKTTFITDQYAALEFAHSGYARAFRIRVTDGRGDLMKDVQIAADELYNSSTGKYEYYVAGLTQKSKYNVTITAVYGDENAKEESKAVKKTFKTTAIPASYISLTKNQYNTGVAIQIYKKNGYGSSSSYIEDVSLTAGNVYTLNVTNGNDNLNEGAKYAQTDTLTWTSSNKKVATVKANKGSFSATLNAVKSGWTVIEVKSKITKAVIARYEIYIYAVGNADSYYGSNEPLPKVTVSEPTYDKPDYREEVITDTEIRVPVLKLNQGMQVSAEAGSYTWVAFTASSAGYYNFASSNNSGDPKVWIFNSIEDANGATSSGDLNNYAVIYDDDDNNGNGNVDGNNFSCTHYMNAGQTVYLAVGYWNLSGSVSATVTATKVN